MRELRHQVRRARVDALARDVGRLRRRFDSNGTAWTGRTILEEIAGHVEALHCMFTPSAGELAAWTAPGDEQAVEESCRFVDQRWQRLQVQLGKKAA
ncbi:MAG TPA: hypothetical protein VFV91_05895 [Gaiellaceae bacterium]|nr:hypothetical protein [Gaiellaceae bacterium]